MRVSLVWDRPLRVPSVMRLPLLDRRGKSWAPVWLAVGFVLWAIGYNLGAPLLTLWAGVLGAGGTEQGLVGATTYGGMAVAGLVSGPLSDRIGRRSVLMGTWALSACGVLS